MHVSDCDDKTADDVIQKLLKIWDKKVDHNYDNECIC